MTSELFWANNHLRSLIIAANFHSDLSYSGHSLFCFSMFLVLAESDSAKISPTTFETEYGGDWIVAYQFQSWKN
jgi:hypothetical protein